tara:strand:+ start:230 stop:331 length:102 start_codon:yes stop_codon:yes gene_type:complete
VSTDLPFLMAAIEAPFLLVERSKDEVLADLREN